MFTPWGATQQIEVITSGVFSVSTASHGGYMVLASVAEERLSVAARTRGIRFGEYYCFEEDCDFAIAAFELKEHWDVIFQHASEKIKDDPERYLLKCLSLWNLDYLHETGVSPDSEASKVYEIRKLEETMRAENHPDLIVVAWGSWETKIPGVIKVGTADGKSHLVKEESYERLTKANGLLLLSQCEKAEDASYPSI